MFTRVMLVNVKVFSVLIHFNEIHEYLVIDKIHKNCNHWLIV